jgi:hypothetical protein
MPYKPKPACPVCRRLGCADPSHKPRPFKDAAPTRERRPEWEGDRKRRRATVKAWLAVNSVPTEDGQRAAICDECGQWSTRFVADHVTPVALSHDEHGPLKVHCVRCSRRQGGMVSNVKRKARAPGAVKKL